MASFLFTCITYLETLQSRILRQMYIDQKGTPDQLKDESCSPQTTITVDMVRCMRLFRTDT